MKKGRKQVIATIHIDAVIHTIRGERVIMDSDLAALYHLPTFRLNEAVKRNRERFPSDFLFQLTSDEYNSLRSQFAMSKRGVAADEPCHMLSQNMVQ